MKWPDATDAAVAAAAPLPPPMDCSCPTNTFNSPEAVFDAHDLEFPLGLELFDRAPHSAHLRHGGDNEGSSQVVLHLGSDPVVVQSYLLRRPLSDARW